MVLGWPEKDDHELLALIQDGSHDAFAVLVQRHTERFYRLAYRYVQNRETAEDIVQDAFLKLWEDPGKMAAGAEQQVHYLVLSHRGESLPRLAEEETSAGAG